MRSRLDRGAAALMATTRLLSAATMLLHAAAVVTAQAGVGAQAAAPGALQSPHLSDDHASWQRTSALAVSAVIVLLLVAWDASGTISAVLVAQTAWKMKQVAYSQMLVYGPGLMQALDAVTLAIDITFGRERQREVSADNQRDTDLSTAYMFVKMCSPQVPYTSEESEQQLVSNAVVGSVHRTTEENETVIVPRHENIQRWYKAISWCSIMRILNGGVVILMGLQLAATAMWTDTHVAYLSLAAVILLLTVISNTWLVAQWVSAGSRMVKDYYWRAACSILRDANIGIRFKDGNKTKTVSLFVNPVSRGALQSTSPWEVGTNWRDGEALVNRAYDKIEGAERQAKMAILATTACLLSLAYPLYAILVGAQTADPGYIQPTALFVSLMAAHNLQFVVYQQVQDAAATSSQGTFTMTNSALLCNNHEETFNETAYKVLRTHGVRPFEYSNDVRALLVTAELASTNSAKYSEFIRVKDKGPKRPYRLHPRVQQE